MALTTAFARNGNRKAVPQASQDGSMSYDQGFGAFYALPPEEGGLFIDRAQFNQLMYDTTSQVIANTTAIATKANANATVNLTGNQTIAGVKTFSSPPVSATNPTNNNQVANKAYVDSVGNAKVATTTYNADKATFATKTELNTKANANATVNLTGNQTINGTKTFNDNIVSPNITAMQNNLNTIFSSTTSPVKTQTGTKVITVGTGGDFADLPSAFKEAKKYTSLISIKLISNLEIASNQDILYVNGHHIILNFNNFKMINTNTSTNVRLHFIGCSIGAIIRINLENIVFGAASGSLVYIQDNVNITSNTDCIRAWHGSYISIEDNTTMNLTHGADRYSIYSSVGSIIGIGGGSTINDSSTDGRVLFAYRGGIIDATDVTINSDSASIANQAANTPTANGIIFGNYLL